jgi:hypothetical protein
MKLFLSWSGERSREIALAFRDWLPLVLHYAEPWVSDADVEAGDRWSQSVATELAATNFGLLLVTSENVESPWLLFEAGALAKSLDAGKVIPALLDLDYADIAGPLAQFQAKKLNREGILEILHSIQGSSDSRIPDESLRQLFDVLWDVLDAKLQKIAEEAPKKRKARPQSEVLEELVSGIRSLEVRIRESQDVDMGSDGLYGRRKMSRYEDPRTLDMLIHSVAMGPDDPVILLVVGSQFRDRAPWIHELALEAYRPIAAKSPGALANLRRLGRALDSLMDHGLAPELGISERNIRHLGFTVQELASRYEEKSEARKKQAGNERTNQNL